MSERFGTSRRLHLLGNPTPPAQCKTYGGSRARSATSVDAPRLFAGGLTAAHPNRGAMSNRFHLHPITPTIQHWSHFSSSPKAGLAGGQPRDQTKADSSRDPCPSITRRLNRVVRALYSPVGVTSWYSGASSPAAYSALVAARMTQPTVRIRRALARATLPERLWAERRPQPAPRQVAPRAAARRVEAAP